MLFFFLHHQYRCLQECFIVSHRREDNKVSHYIINKIQQGDQTRYKIGDQMFTDLPALLNFYKVHYLDTTPLIRPAPKRVEKVLAKYDFEGNVSNATFGLYSVPTFDCSHLGPPLKYFSGNRHPISHLSNFVGRGFLPSHR